jgi:hypothetical protein
MHYDLQNLVRAIEAGEDADGSLRGLCDEASAVASSIPLDAVDEAEEGDDAEAAPAPDDDADVE